MTTSQTTPIQKKSRIEAVDALRGFAVLAILVLHCTEHFFMFEKFDQPSWLATLDQAVNATLTALIGGKAYAIFALLFGFTFYIQQSAQRAKGTDFGPRFLWRLLLLGGFAMLNSLFFPGGDVLLMLATSGVVLFIVRNWSDRWLVVAAVFLLLQPEHWYRLLFPEAPWPDLHAGEAFQQIKAYIDEGGPAEYFRGNLTVGVRAALVWAFEVGRSAQSAGLFILGLLLGRKGLFVDSEQSRRFWMWALVVSALAYAPLAALRGVTWTGFPDTSWLLRQTFDMWQKVTFMAVLVSSFMLLYAQKEWFRRVTAPLRPYGRMSLTNYITQGIIGALIFLPIGLHLAPVCGITVSVLIGMLIFGVQLAFSIFWLRRHRQGPLEWLWHKLTWIGGRKTPGRETQSKS